jgi:asparagine N-glycosylation enzyme membrane subunit Stt3
MHLLPVTFKLMPLAILLGLVTILISIPLLYHAVAPNRLYGFRTRKTLSNSDIWYKANKFMARELVAAGAVSIMLAIVAMLVYLRIIMFTDIQATGLFILIFLVPLVIAIFRSLSYLKKL